MEFILATVHPFNGLIKIDLSKNFENFSWIKALKTTIYSHIFLGFASKKKWRNSVAASRVGANRSIAYYDTRPLSNAFENKNVGKTKHENNFVMKSPCWKKQQQLLDEQYHPKQYNRKSYTMHAIVCLHDMCCVCALSITIHYPPPSQYSYRVYVVTIWLCRECGLHGCLFCANPKICIHTRTHHACKQNVVLHSKTISF